jgi:hypothetical protein
MTLNNRCNNINECVFANCEFLFTIHIREEKKDFYYTINHVRTQKKSFH